MNIQADTRNLAKWLNEESTREIDRPALARVLAHLQQAEQAQPVADINVRPPLKGGDGPLIASVFWHKLPVGSWLLYTAPPPHQPELCTWSQVDDEHTPDTWAASCGAMWTFTDGGPKDNDMSYCPKCGKAVIESTHGIGKEENT